jgi:hypothetical protein
LCREAMIVGYAVTKGVYIERNGICCASKDATGGIDSRLVEKVVRVGEARAGNALGGGVDLT